MGRCVPHTKILYTKDSLQVNSKTCFPLVSELSFPPFKVKHLPDVVSIGVYPQGNQLGLLWEDLAGCPPVLPTVLCLGQQDDKHDSSHNLFIELLFCVGPYSKCKYSRFSLFTLVLFYNISPNTELMNSEPLLLGEIQDVVPTSLWSQHFCQLVST